MLEIRESPRMPVRPGAPRYSHPMRTSLAVLLIVGTQAACQGSATHGSKPVIGTFSASPTTIPAGGSSVLSWTVSGAASLELNPGQLNVTGKSDQTARPAATSTYVLKATNEAGTTESSVR
jgi:hypothetical protein